MLEFPTVVLILIVFVTQHLSIVDSMLDEGIDSVVGWSMKKVPLNVVSSGKNYPTDADTPNDREFIPTSEWQTIEPGQHIPPGLHVRINLETGVKEAKLIGDDNDEEVEELDGRRFRALQESPDVNAADLISKNGLKRALHKIVDDGINVQEHQHKFRSMDELKSELAALNMTIRTEAEIVHNLLHELNQSGLDDERRAAILQDLEFYVHQYDNAVDFVKMGGLVLLPPLLNSSADIVRSAAAFLLGSAMQSNPSVQLSAVDSGLLHRLLNRLAIEPSASVKNKVLYAVSCLLRRFPHAQLKFVELDGLSIVKAFFDKKHDGQEAHERLRLKTITLLYDLVVEHDDVQLRTEGNTARQYDTVGIKRAMIETDFCSLVSRLLMQVPPPSSLSTTFEHDALERILSMMKVMATGCRMEFSQLAGRLWQLHREYDRLADRKSGGKRSFLAGIRQTVASLIDVVDDDNNDLKDEL